MVAITNDEANTLAAKLEALAANPDLLAGLTDDNARRRLREASRKLSIAVEIKGDTINRICYLAATLALGKVGTDHGIFEALAGAKAPLSNTEIAEVTKVDPILMKRLLRFYQSQYIISQPGEDAYAANNVTRALGSPEGKAAMDHNYASINPAVLALPEFFLSQPSPTNPTDPLHCAFQVGQKTDLHPFEWGAKRPELQATFMRFMTSQREGLPGVFDAIDFEVEFFQVGAGGADTPLFLDIGGGVGHQALALKTRYPGLVGRVVLQDLPPVIELAKGLEQPGFDGIEVMPHDIFTEQPVKGSRVYYLRNVLHDWPDHACIQILQNLNPALGPDSVVLVDEIAAKERTLAEWEAIVGDSGFAIDRVMQYTAECEDCVLVLKSRGPQYRPARLRVGRTAAELQAAFLRLMMAQNEGQKAIFDAIDFEAEFFQGSAAGVDTPLFLDIGGAGGHQALALKARYPELRVILQDLPLVIEHAESWARGAPGRDGVLSERDGPWAAAQFDIVMMASFAAKERTPAEWKTVVRDAGFVVDRVVRYSEENGDSVLVLKQRA
ncbi:hypothetical protein HK405_004538 [Cladochytrium tenue]|nr:hypothetical protein HK405_004538 [Cladochytrium tenue]